MGGRESRWTRVSKYVTCWVASVTTKTKQVTDRHPGRPGSSRRRGEPALGSGTFWTWLRCEAGGRAEPGPHPGFCLEQVEGDSPASRPDSCFSSLRDSFSFRLHQIGDTFRSQSSQDEVPGSTFPRSFPLAVPPGDLAAPPFSGAIRPGGACTGRQPRHRAAPRGTAGGPAALLGRPCMGTLQAARGCKST